MELARQREPLEFGFKDVTFLVKPQTVEADRMEIRASGSVQSGKIIAPQAEFIKAVLRCFVIGWRGVTLDGQPVPYSLETFLRYFPRSTGSNEPDVILQLCEFIAKETDLFKEDEAAKKA